jgi:cytoskeletal protein CcmA (bactofilin family)
MKSTSPLNAAPTAAAPVSQPSTMPANTRPNLGGITPRSARSGGSEGERRLHVGRGLSVSGEITACDVLVVEGKVEAKLSDGKLIEIAESGQFRGSVEIENADIAGRYDGELTVHGRLTVRSTGRISGMVKYGELEVNPGGQIIGEMQVVGTSAAAASSSFTAQAPSFKSAAKFTSLVDDEEETVSESKKVANG